jgi:murein DD-endopeptidase MepM/ murein hydrolase activator NlpD
MAKGLFMLTNIKFFVVSSKSLDFREIKFFKTKLVGSGLVVGLVTVGCILLVNFLLNDVFGIGVDRMNILNAENQLLKEQVKSMGQRMSSVQGALEGLAARGNELRLMVNLSKIDDDTRAAATGGATAPTANAFLTGDAAEVLSSSQAAIEKLTREIKLQQASYEEISKRVEFNKGFFNHLPAIKPMAGPYSINGFGMRVHPVLHVYRMHEGIDIINDVGTNVYSAADGTVHFAGRTAGGYGVVIEVSHGYGYSSLYAHLEKVLVRPGQPVRRGELIGKCGRSGLVSGPHLHFEVRRDGRKQNPVDYFFDDVEAARYRAQLASMH